MSMPAAPDRFASTERLIRVAAVLSLSAALCGCVSAGASVTTARTDGTTIEGRTRSVGLRAGCTPAGCINPTAAAGSDEAFD